LRNLHGMKVTIIKAVNATGKIWAEGSTPSVTRELYERLLKGGYCLPLNGDEAPAADPELKAEEVVDEPRPRPTRKPRKPKK
jgi:hypothetical protein